MLKLPAQISSWYDSVQYQSISLGPSFNTENPTPYLQLPFERPETRYV